MAYRKILPAVCFAGIACLAPRPGFSQTDTQFVSLYNGTDLTGWSVKTAGTAIKNFATIKDGYIDLESAGGSGWLWLYSDKAYTDFDLKMKFSAPTGEQGNSGVNFRRGCPSRGIPTAAYQSRKSISGRARQEKPRRISAQQA